MNSFNGKWDDQTCFNWEMSHGINLESVQFENMYKNTADTVNRLISFETVSDLGGGVGAYSRALKRLGKTVNYYDANAHHLYYAQGYNVAHTYTLGDFSTKTIEADLVVCIEVMEHMTDDSIKRTLDNCNCKYFHFSSTPHTNKMDEDWGHINIKQENEWIELFKQHGFNLKTKVSVPTQWSLLYEKAR